MQRALAVVLTLLAVVIDQLTTPALAPASRAIQASLRLDAPTAMRIGIGFDAAYFLAIALSFRGIVVLGKRRFFGATFIGFALASLVCAFAPNAAVFAAARVLQGATLGGVFTAALLTLMGACPPRFLALAFAWFSILSLATPSFAPMFSGILMHLGTWRAIFVTIAIPAFAGGIGGLLLFRDPYPAKRVPFDLVAFAALVAFVLGLETLIAAGANAVAATAAVLGAGVYVVRESRTATPFFNLRLFASRLVGQSATIGLLLGMLLASATALVAFALGPLHFDPSTAATLLALRFTGIIVGVPVVTIVGDRLGAKTAMLVGLVIVALSFVAQHVVSLHGAAFGPLAAIGIVQGFAFAFIVGPLASIVFSSVSHDELPSMAVIFKLSTLLGVSLAGPLVAAFLALALVHDGTAGDALTRAYADLWIAGAGVAVVAAALVVALRLPPPAAAR